MMKKPRAKKPRLKPAPRRAPSPPAPSAQNEATERHLKRLGIDIASFDVPDIDDVYARFDQPGAVYGESVPELQAAGYTFVRAADRDVEALKGKGWQVVPNKKVQFRGNENVGVVMIRDPKTSQRWAAARQRRDDERRRALTHGKSNRDGLTSRSRPIKMTDL